MPGPPPFVGSKQAPGTGREERASEADMPVTTTTLTRAAGLAAVAAGSLFVAVQVKHLEITVDFVHGTQWTVRQGDKVSMALLALAGIAGMYLRRARHLDPHWSARFAGLALAHPADGSTTLSGAVADQAELHGILIRCATSASRSSPSPRRRRAPPRREHRAGSAHVVAHIYDTAYVVGMPQRAVLEAITDPTRRRILDAVRGGERSVTELLRAVQGDRAVAPHARHLLLAATGHGGDPTAVPRPGIRPLPEPLSQRELQVLRLLDGELSGPDIARALFISPNTLRTHTKHVFTKLGVTSRREAVARARQRGLLEPPAGSTSHPAGHIIR